MSFFLGIPMSMTVDEIHLERRRGGQCVSRNFRGGLRSLCVGVTQRGDKVVMSALLSRSIYFREVILRMGEIVWAWL